MMVNNRDPKGDDWVAGMQRSTVLCEEAPEPAGTPASPGLEVLTDHDHD